MNEQSLFMNEWIKFHCNSLSPFLLQFDLFMFLIFKTLPLTFYMSLVLVLNEQ